jgi:GNAT superfamily N-acetyltransferase
MATSSRSKSKSGKTRAAARRKVRPVRAKARKAATRSRAKATAKVRRSAPAKVRPAARKAAKAAAKRAGKSSARRAAKPPRKAAPAVPVRSAAATTTALHWADVLLDGTHVVIRPIRKEDVALERAFIERLSPESRRMRFLGLVKEPSEELLHNLTDLDYRRDMAFIALVHRDGKTLEIGVSRYSTSDDGRSCECAVTVSDEWHHLGLATLLMRHLIDVARQRGIRTMFSYDAVENVEMQQLARFLGFERIADPADQRMVVHRLKL